MRYLTPPCDVTALTSTYSTADNNENIMNMLITCPNIQNSTTPWATTSTPRCLLLVSWYNSSLYVTAREICCKIIVISEPHNHFTNEVLAPPLPFSFVFFFLFLSQRLVSIFISPPRLWVRPRRTLTCQHAQTISWNPPWLSGPVDHESRKRYAKKKNSLMVKYSENANVFSFFFSYLFHIFKFGQKKKKRLNPKTHKAEIEASVSFPEECWKHKGG